MRRSCEVGIFHVQATWCWEMGGAAIRERHALRMACPGRWLLRCTLRSGSLEDSVVHHLGAATDEADVHRRNIFQHRAYVQHRWIQSTEITLKINEVCSRDVNDDTNARIPAWATTFEQTTFGIWSAIDRGDDPSPQTTDDLSPTTAHGAR